jgi:hypothetical protein
MEFFIKKNSEQPILIMEIVQDGRTQNYVDFQEKLVNSTIRFSMKRESDGLQKIFMNNSYITEKLLNNPDSPKEYYIYYKWTSRDTNQEGRFIGEFSIITDSGELVAPIREKLYINIL